MRGDIHTIVNPALFDKSQFTQVERTRCQVGTELMSNEALATHIHKWSLWKELTQFVQRGCRGR